MFACQTLAYATRGDLSQTRETLIKSLTMASDTDSALVAIDGPTQSPLPGRQATYIDPLTGRELQVDCVTSNRRKAGVQNASD